MWIEEFRERHSVKGSQVLDGGVAVAVALVVLVVFVALLAVALAFMAVAVAFMAVLAVVAAAVVCAHLTCCMESWRRLMCTSA